MHRSHRFVRPLGSLVRQPRFASLPIRALANRRDRQTTSERGKYLFRRRGDISFFESLAKSSPGLLRPRWTGHEERGLVDRKRAGFLIIVAADDSWFLG